MPTPTGTAGRGRRGNAGFGARRLPFRWRPLLGASLVWLSLAAGPPLEIQPRDPHGWVLIRSVGQSEQAHLLQATRDWTNWSTIATLHDAPLAFADPASGLLDRRYYRLSSRAKTSADDGKNGVLFPEERFRSPLVNPEESRWIKFAILLNDTNRVWFQDSAKYPFHYDYAVRRLEPFVGLSRLEFDAATLYRANQVAVLGALLYAPGSARPEFGIQFVGLDPYAPAQVAQWFHLVRSAVLSEGPTPAFYLPAVEQLPTAEANRDYLEQHGVPISRADRWLRDDACYAPGWALGRLVFVPAADLNAAYADGRLRPADILLTDGVPAEVPYVAGLMSLVPATPNSHVAILARSYGVPFVYPANAAYRDWVRTLAGREVLLRLDASSGFCVAKVMAVSDDLDPEVRAAILALKAPGPIQITPKARFGAVAADTTNLNPADTRFFGGKAAHFGLLRRTLPTNSPVAIAFSFDLWEDFLNQVVPGTGRTLRQEIRARTAGFTYPPNVREATAVLAGIRDLIRSAAQFSAPQKQAILTALAGFSPDRKIRFRSSTNVEDSEQFTGAGLYDSFSGCLADDLDGNDTGPSHCDPADVSERGVFRAMQRVYASFYNDNAWLERLRFGLEEDDVGMAVLAHHSFPDEDELANGVATLSLSVNGSFRSYQGELASQAGAVSVANPEGGILPEVVTLYSSGAFLYLNTRDYSNLVPLGANVLTWQAEYQSLAGLLMRVADAYQQLFPKKNPFTLDFEYKKIRPGSLMVKQVRELPSAATGEKFSTFLLNEPSEYRVLQGEHGDVFANHRLKCRLVAETRSGPLQTTNLTRSLYTNASLELLDRTNVLLLAGGPSGWPAVSYALAADQTQDRWLLGNGPTSRRFALVTSVIREVTSPNCPVLTQRDLPRQLQVTHTTPMLVGHPDGTVTYVTQESVTLAVPTPVTPQCQLQHRVMTSPTGRTVESSFYWPEDPRGPSAGYTAPVVEWVETSITGLTTEALVLRGYYAQTYRPGHHNFWEEFIFEPRLDPGVGPDQLQELAARDVQLLYAVYEAFGSTQIFVLGSNGTLRPLE